MTNPMRAIVRSSCLCPPGEPEVQPDEMLTGKAEERLDAPVVFDRLPHDKPEKDPQAHLGVVHGVCLRGEIPVDTGLEAGPAERCGIGGSYEKEPPAAPGSGIHERRRRPERVEIDRVKGLLEEQRAGIPAGDRDGKPGPGDILLDYGDRLRVLVVDRDRDPHSFATQSPRTQLAPIRVDIIRGFEKGKEQDRRIPVDLHPPV